MFCWKYGKRLELQGKNIITVCSFATVESIASSSREHATILISIDKNITLYDIFFALMQIKQIYNNTATFLVLFVFN